MFLLLVTNKQSNILEDLDTLRLLSKVVPEYCGVRPACAAPSASLTRLSQVVEEESVCKNAFELIFAFDEVRRSPGSLRTHCRTTHLCCTRRRSSRWATRRM